VSSETGTEDLHRALGLTDDEYQQIEQILGRSPNRAELAMYSVMWSEHCSYKSSRVHLRNLPTEGPYVLVGPGEGAGIIKVDDMAVAIRIESHNHPSFVEPVQGAATGIGGVVRDVLSVGARPIALLDPLRFGPLPGDGNPANAGRNRFLTEGVVSGISSYGNCIGVPTVGGEIKFEDAYSGNPLVNVMCVGVSPADRIIKAEAPGPGNAVLLLGSTTGRDGIGGVSVLASATFDEQAAVKRPSVQVGDPFTEKLLIEACLGLVEKDLVVGVQDLGGAGLCCATSESAARAGTGMEIDLDKVPKREPGMEPFEILTSESQERMLVIVTPGNVEPALAVCDHFGLLATRIGTVTDTGRLVALQEGRVVADVPAASLGDGPVYNRPMSEPASAADEAGVDQGARPDPAEALLKLVGSPNLASKRWVFEQYDHQVMLNTLAGPGHDAAVLRIPGAPSRIALTTDGNGRFTQLDPFLGAEHCVAEAYRNLSVVGALPVAITNCLNFGSPEDPEVMWSFARAVEGISEACRALETPVTGGNVSFYNQTLDRAIYPTPIIGMVGILPEGVTPPSAGFVNEGDRIVLIGSTADEMGGSEYQRTIEGRLAGIPPRLNLVTEAIVGSFVRQAVAEGTLNSAHDCSEGGIGVTLAEMSAIGGKGAEITPEEGIDLTTWLFSESASRVIATFAPVDLVDFRASVEEAGVAVVELGSVRGGTVDIEGVASIDVAQIRRVFEGGFAKSIG
jgi:phosphoribosylformylglycinamidine synthase subunit PurL